MRHCIGVPKSEVGQETYKKSAFIHCFLCGIATLSECVRVVHGSSDFLVDTGECLVNTE